MGALPSFGEYLPRKSKEVANTIMAGPQLSAERPQVCGIILPPSKCRTFCERKVVAGSGLEPPTPGL